MSEEAQTLSELLYESLGFHQEDDEANAFALLKFCEALCTPGQLIYDVVREREDQPGWAVLLDPDECPAVFLPYLAQWVGVVITPEMDEAQIREEIREPTGWKRGQPESIRIALRRTLTGEEPLIIIRPRTPEVGRHYIRTLLSQTPVPSRTKALLREKLAAWEVLDYEAIAGNAFTDVTASKYTTFAALAGAFPDFQALTESLPGDL